MWGGQGVDPDDRLDRGQARNVLARSARLAGPYRRQIVAAVVFVTLATVCTLAGPVVIRHGIDAGIKPRDGGAIRAAVVLYVVVMAANYVVSRQQHLFVNRAGEAFLRDLRVRAFGRLQAQSMAFFDREKAGVLVARMTADIESMAELIQWGLLQFVSAALLVVLAFVLLFTMSWQLALVVLAVMPLIGLASIRFQRDANAAYLTVRERVGAMLSSLQEGITGVRVIQAFAREDEQIRRFNRANRELYRSHMHSVRVSTWYFGLVEFCGMFATGLVIGVGGWLVQRGEVTIGTVTAFVLLLTTLFDPVQVLSQLYNTMQSAAASLHKIYALMDAVPDVDERPGAVDLPSQGALIVEGVSFTYAGAERPALHDVSLRVADGERLALVGPTGAGKSTLAKLMARLYDPTAGTVSYGGVDLRSATLSSLRQRMVVVPQEGFLFGGTVRENIRIARPDASDADVEEAVRSIGAWDRFAAFPEGLETEVRERGSRLSAGERQLVSIARAALVDPAILVLDEATSNLDPGTEAAVEQAMERVMTGRTTIVVAHRLSTVRRADRIAVVDGGRLAELGTHDELVAAGGRYAGLAAAWAAHHPSVTARPASP
jgi:ATP-binding cassette subfamily B protein